MNTNENITTTTGDDDLFLPEGWAEGADIFSPDTWGATEAQADESAAEVASVEEQVEAEASTETPTPESTDLSGDTAGDVDTAPTTEQTEAEPANRLKFKARVDRADIDVELDESELPTIYQKAQVTDRLSAKLGKLNPQMEKVERLAKTLGFQSIDEMIDNAEKNYRDTEVSRLVGEGVHEEVAKDVVSRRMTDRTTAPTHEQTEPERAPVSTGRDFQTEVRELLDARKDLAGTTLPPEVVEDCVKNNKRLIVAYAEFEQRKVKAENERLAKKVKALEQNASAAARSPVVGVTGGGPTDVKPDDDFTKGFNSI
jgi:hypothetical protein